MALADRLSSKFHSFASSSVLGEIFIFRTIYQLRRLYPTIYQPAEGGCLLNKYLTKIYLIGSLGPVHTIPYSYRTVSKIISDRPRVHTGNACSGAIFVPECSRNVTLSKVIRCVPDRFCAVVALQCEHISYRSGNEWPQKPTEDGPETNRSRSRKPIILSRS